MPWIDQWSWKISRTVIVEKKSNPNIPNTGLAKIGGQLHSLKTLKNVLKSAQKGYTLEIIELEETEKRFFEI